MMLRLGAYAVQHDQELRIALGLPSSDMPSPKSKEDDTSVGPNDEWDEWIVDPTQGEDEQ